MRDFHLTKGSSLRFHRYFQFLELQGSAISLQFTKNIAKPLHLVFRFTFSGEREKGSIGRHQEMNELAAEIQVTDTIVENRRTHYHLVHHLFSRELNFQRQLVHLK